MFDAWVDPEVARRFLFATETGTIVRAETDPRVGGRFVFVDRRPDAGEVLHEGEYLEIDRPRRLAFTFAVPQYDPAKTTVALDFAPYGHGKMVTLTHTEVLRECLEPTRQGRTMILASLEEALSR